MKKANDIREGNLILMDDEVYRVDGVELKGSAKAHKQVGLKLRSVPHGKFKDIAMSPEDKVEEADVIHKKAVYSYRDNDNYYFMDPQTFETHAIANTIIGKKSCFLKEEQEINVTFFQERLLEVSFPKRIKLKVTSADKGVKGGQESGPYKKARLENGLEVDVPQFMKDGDTIEVDTETFAYINRVIDSK